MFAEESLFLRWDFLWSSWASLERLRCFSCHNTADPSRQTLTLPSGATDPVVPGLYNHPLPCLLLEIGPQPCASHIPPHCIGPSVSRPSPWPGTKRLCPEYSLCQSFLSHPSKVPIPPEALLIVMPPDTVLSAPRSFSSSTVHPHSQVQIFSLVLSSRTYPACLWTFG